MYKRNVKPLPFIIKPLPLIIPSRTIILFRFLLRYLQFPAWIRRLSKGKPAIPSWFFNSTKTKRWVCIWIFPRKIWRKSTRTNCKRKWAVPLTKSYPESSNPSSKGKSPFREPSWEHPVRRRTDFYRRSKKTIWAYGHAVWFIFV